MKKTDFVSFTRTARDTGERLARLTPVAWQDAVPSLESDLVVQIDAGVRYQRIEGFGGAFTEAAAVTLNQLPTDRQKQILNAYFNPVDGHGYTLCRTHINSCDFSLGNYAYVEQAGDTEFKSFSLERDQQHLLPMIEAARAIAAPGLKLLASPWSPPAWMKTTDRMNQGGKLRPEFRDAWARYYCRYIVEMAKLGHPIWGLTVQNEPASAQPWDSCQYTAEEERDFVRDYLGPALHAAGLADVKLIVWDHNRNLAYERVQPIYDDPEAARYVWGTGLHWYMADCFGNLKAIHDRWPDKAILFTEGCQEGGPHPGAWGLGERYARSIVADLNNWAVGWIDWNLLLDYTGGPNHVGNLCSAPILADPQTGDVLYQSSYYYIGHFSRFIKPGAHRIICAQTRDEAECTAFQNPDGSFAVVILNRTETNLPLTLRCQNRAAHTLLAPRSIITATFSLPTN